MIVEFFFALSSSSIDYRAFWREEQLDESRSYSTILMDRDHTQTLESQLKQITSKQDYLFMNCNQGCKNPLESQMLTYSKTGSQIFAEDLGPLLKRIVSLLSSKEHIGKHVENSLGMKGYSKELAAEVARVVAQSFGQYIGIARTLNQKQTALNEQATDSIRRLKGQITNLKMQNALQYQQLHKLQQQSIHLKYKASRVQSSKSQESSHRQQVVLAVEREIAQIHEKMDGFQTEIYRRLMGCQHSLLTMSQSRNTIMLKSKYSSGVEGQAQESERSEVKQLRTELERVSSELGVQQRLYDDMLNKNIQLQREMLVLNENSFCSEYSKAEGRRQELAGDMNTY